MEFKIGGDDSGGEFGVCRRSSSRAPYLGRDVMEFFAILDGHPSVRLEPCVFYWGFGSYNLVSYYRA